MRLGELIASGHLVPPRTFVIDVGVQDKLKAVRKTASDFDMGEVAEIMDRAPITEEVVRHWQEKAPTAPRWCSARPWPTPRMWPRPSTPPASPPA